MRPRIIIRWSLALTCYTRGCVDYSECIHRVLLISSLQNQNLLSNPTRACLPVLVNLAEPFRKFHNLVMYGAVRNTAASNARLITGNLTWTITPASGAPVTVTPVAASRQSAAISSHQKELRRSPDAPPRQIPAYSPTVLSA